MDNRSFYRLRCKWFGHKWELRLIRNQIIDWNSIFKNLNPMSGLESDKK